jgi:hypothetical protein
MGTEPESYSKPPGTSAPVFPLKDLLSVLLSASALIVSLAGFYFGNLKVDDNLQMRVVDVSPEPTLGEKSDYPGRGPYLVAHTALVNAGNRPALVMAVSYNVGPPGEHWDFSNQVATDGKLLPFVIQPHDIRMVDFGIPEDSLVGNLSSGSPVKDPNDPGPVAEFNCSFGVVSLDSGGVSHQIMTLPHITARATQTRLLGFKALNTGKATLLFR